MVAFIIVSPFRETSCLAVSLVTSGLFVPSLTLILVSLVNTRLTITVWPIIPWAVSRSGATPLAVARPAVDPLTVIFWLVRGSRACTRFSTLGAFTTIIFEQWLYEDSPVLKGLPGVLDC